MADIEAFLAEQPSAMRRERVEVQRTDLLPGMQRWGDAWRALCGELGAPCPDELILLGDAMDRVLIYIEVDEHFFAMLTPPQARQERAFLRELAAEVDPALRERAGMLPIFGEDGDLLLLDHDGALHRFCHDDWGTDAIVAASLAELITRARPGTCNPA